MCNGATGLLVKHAAGLGDSQCKESEFQPWLLKVVKDDLKPDGLLCSNSLIKLSFFVPIYTHTHTNEAAISPSFQECAVQ